MHMSLKPQNPAPAPGSEGWTGWDEYAPFYDWENARTQGRRDVPFWRRLTGGVRGRVLAPGGTFGIDLVPDVASWREYRNRVQLRGRAAGGAYLTLIESVRQDR